MMNVNETVFLCIKGPLTADEVELLKQGTLDLYQINMVLDSLPVTRFAKGLRWTGIPLGYKASIGNDVYLINHLKFRVIIHEQKGGGLEKGSGFEIVGFEVDHCCVKHNLDEISKLHMNEDIQPIDCHLVIEKVQVVRENETIAFTYEVEFVKSDITWPSRWDSYLEMEDAKARRSCILYTVITFLILENIMLFRLWTKRRDLKRDMNGALSGWELVVDDVFREPGCAKLLCVMVGDGVQITSTTLVTFAFSALGFMSPVSRGMLLTTFIMFYLFFSIVAGYASVRLWRTIKTTSEGWKSVSWSVACSFPGIVFIALTFSNVLLYGTKTTKTIPIYLFLILLSLWLCISVPLTLIGGFIGTKATAIPYPVRINQVPRQIPSPPKFSWRVPINYPRWLHIFVVGFIPYSILSYEQSRILWRIWLGRLYTNFGVLLFVLLMLLVVCAQVSVLIAYKLLRLEDWRWWWKAFFTSGSAGIYVFYYSINYLVKLRGLNGPVLATLYVGYSLIVAIAVMLASGRIGFLVSFYFVHRLYSSVKISC